MVIFAENLAGAVRDEQASWRTPMINVIRVTVTADRDIEFKTPKRIINIDTREVKRVMEITADVYRAGRDPFLPALVSGKDS